MRENKKIVNGTAEIIGTLVIAGFNVSYDHNEVEESICINKDEFIDLTIFDENLTVSGLIKKANDFIKE